MDGRRRAMLPAARRHAAAAARGGTPRPQSGGGRRRPRQPDGVAPQETAGRGIPRTTDPGRAVQRGRDRPAPAVGTDPGAESRRQALPRTPAARQTVPAVPARPDQSDRRLSGQQQPDPIRPVAAGRTQRRRAGPRRLPEVGRLVRGALDRPLVRGHLGRTGGDHRRELGARQADPAAPHLHQDGLPPVAGGPRRPDRVPHPARLRHHPARLSGRGREDRRPPPEPPWGRPHRRRGGAGQDAHGDRAGPRVRGRPGPGDADPLPEEPRVDVGGLPCPVPIARPRPVGLARDERVAPPAPVPPGRDRREPQSPQPRGQAVSDHSGIRAGKRQQVHPAVRHAVQQDVRRLVQPVAPVRARGRRPGHPPGTPAARPRRDRVRPPASGPGARWPRSNSRSTRKTGGN